MSTPITPYKITPPPYQSMELPAWLKGAEKTESKKETAPRSENKVNGSDFLDEMVSTARDGAEILAKGLAGILSMGCAPAPTAPGGKEKPNESNPPEFPVGPLSVAGKKPGNISKPPKGQYKGVLARLGISSPQYHPAGSDTTGFKIGGLKVRAIMSWDFDQTNPLTYSQKGVHGSLAKPDQSEPYHLEFTVDQPDPNNPGKFIPLKGLYGGPFVFTTGPGWVNPNDSDDYFPARYASQNTGGVVYDKQGNLVFAPDSSLIHPVYPDSLSTSSFIPPLSRIERIITNGEPADSLFGWMDKRGAGQKTPWARSVVINEHFGILGDLTKGGGADSTAVYNTRVLLGFALADSTGKILGYSIPFVGKK